jgi:poly(3-hydroxybutyrate) depolymerase
MKRLLMLTIALVQMPLLAQPAPDAAFDRFWRAATVEEREAAAGDVVRSGITEVAALARLRQGRPYSADVPRGVVRRSHRAAGHEFAFTLDVPDAYTPAKKYPVRVHLHGGVGRPSNDPRPSSGGGIGQLAGAAEQIYVLPTAWREAPWWSDAQLASLRVILDEVKRTYNVDENRVIVSGVSDGGTGAFYVAMRDTTPYAAFLPLNGFLMVLANASLELREILFPHNLRNKPFFAVNGGRDPLYPTELVDPYIRHLQQGGVTIDYRPQPDAGHNTAWWPDLKEPFDAFAAAHPREPNPARVTWETERVDTAARAHWLTIDELRAPRASAALLDVNERVSGRELNFGVRTAGMRIVSVESGSNAERLGFRPEDVVAGINGRALPAGLDLVEFLTLYKPGDTLTFEVVRPDNTERMKLAGVYQPSVANRVTPLFPRPRPTGRVDAERNGNSVKASTRGVAAFSLLLSRDVFDFEKPLVVEADGRVVFNGRIEPSLATLMKWAARDNDRTLLYSAELRISVP